MREVPGEVAEAECTLERAKEVSWALAKKDRTEEGRNQGKESGARESVVCVK